MDHGRQESPKASCQAASFKSSSPTTAFTSLKYSVTVAEIRSIETAGLQASSFSYLGTGVGVPLGSHLTTRDVPHGTTPLTSSR